MDDTRSRRDFLAAGLAVGLTAASWRRVLGANERVGVGFIGFGLIGKRHVLDFRREADVDGVAIAEVHRGRLDEAAGLLGPEARKYRDFRALLDDRSVDAVVVSTPDHWHALQAMLACAAGKDVYVEKPLTLFVAEGRWLIDVARRHGRVVQVGTQQRSGPHYQRARDLVRGGHIGKVVSVRMAASRNVMPGFGRPEDGPAPPEIDYDLWLGPAPARAYNPNRCLYHFRWFWDYSGGQMTNLGVHSIDILDWFLDVDGPAAVSSSGGRFALEDNGETPDTQDALFEYPGFLASWTHREAAAGPTRPSGLEFIGTKGSMVLSRSGFTVTADPRVRPEDLVPQFTDSQPVGGVQRSVDAAPRSSWTEPLEDKSGSSLGQFQAHVRDFLDSVKSRRPPRSTLESAHRSATAAHLANMALRTGKKLRWDARKEQILGDDEANAHLVRPYRAPWDRELRALGIST
jgi:predicted dehydrogenase